MIIYSDREWEDIVIISMREVSTMTKKFIGFTTDEERKIQEAVKAHNEKVRQAEIDAEIRNRIADEQRTKPGYKY